MTKEQTMSALRTRMIEDMQLAGLSAKTQEVYLQAVTALVKHYGNRSPDQLTEEEVRCYVLAVRQRNARGTFKTCHYGIQFFYRNTLGKDWALFKKDPAPPAEAPAADAFPCRGGTHSGRHPQPDPLRLLPPDVCLRPAHQRGRRSPRHRHRQDQRPVAGRRQGQQGTHRAGAQAGPREPARRLASTLVVGFWADPQCRFAGEFEVVIGADRLRWSCKTF